MYEDYLDKNEEVLWQGKPNSFIYATGGSASILQIYSIKKSRICSN